jgi:hypothetical protein
LGQRIKGCTLAIELQRIPSSVWPSEDVEFLGAVGRVNSAGGGHQDGGEKQFQSTHERSLELIGRYWALCFFFIESACLLPVTAQRGVLA